MQASRPRPDREGRVKAPERIPYHCASCGAEGFDANGEVHRCVACICRTESDPFKPCPLPKDAHREDGYEIRSGPDREQRYLYTKFWYDLAARRSRAQELFATQPVGDPQWKAAKVAYSEAPVLEAELDRPLYGCSGAPVVDPEMQAARLARDAEIGDPLAVSEARRSFPGDPGVPPCGSFGFMPRAPFFRGYVIHCGPDSEQRYHFVKFGYDRNREFLDKQPWDDPLWKPAKVAYITPRCNG